VTAFLQDLFTAALADLEAGGVASLVPLDRLGLAELLEWATLLFSGMGLTP